MTGAPERENGGALPEGTDTAVSAADTRASRAVDMAQVISARAIRQMSRFLRWLADTPEAVKLDRYRDNDGPDDGMCVECGTTPAAYHGSCFGCLRKRGVPSL